MVGAPNALAGAPDPVRYEISVVSLPDHRLHISMSFASGEEQRLFQLPTWYALYQIRNFSQFVEHPKAFSAKGKALPLHSPDKTSWIVSGDVPASRFEYDFRCQLEGAYGNEISTDRITMNPALLLTFTPATAGLRSVVTFKHLPVTWQIHSPLEEHQGQFSAENYEQLADSPFWIGSFSARRYKADQTFIQIIVDGSLSSVDLNDLVSRNRQIVNAEREWMGEIPIKSYSFFYRISPHGDTEGMEHAAATSISVPVSSLTGSMGAFDNVSAHEFFHLWNVIRIRPCSLEPVDFLHEQYSPALWFSEGATSAVSRYILLRAGLMTEKQYLERLGDSIDELERTPARNWQSVEDASVSVWLSGTAAYDSSQRSVSYYRKGEMLTILMDLMIRKETHDNRSIRDVFRFMEQRYGRHHQCFADSAAIEKVMERVIGRPVPGFFKNYVSGVKELPFEEYLGFVGLKLEAVPAPADRGGSRIIIVDRSTATPEERQARSKWLGTQSSEH